MAEGGGLEGGQGVQAQHLQQGVDVLQAPPASGVDRLSTRADTQAEHSARQYLVPGQGAGVTHHLEPSYAQNQRKTSGPHLPCRPMGVPVTSHRCCAAVCSVMAATRPVPAFWASSSSRRHHLHVGAVSTCTGRTLGLWLAGSAGVCNVGQPLSLADLPPAASHSRCISTTRSLCLQLSPETRHCRCGALNPKP